MKISDHQKQVIRLMRHGYVIHRIGGIAPRVFISGTDNHNFKLSIATAYKLDDLKLLTFVGDEFNGKYVLSDLGRTIEI